MGDDYECACPSHKTWKSVALYAMLVMVFVTFVLTSVILGGQSSAGGDGNVLPASSVANVEALWGSLDAKMTSDIAVRYGFGATLNLPNGIRLKGWEAIAQFWTSHFSLYWTSSHQRTALWPTHVAKGIIYAGTFTYSVKTPGGSSTKSVPLSVISVFEFGDGGKTIESQWLYWDTTPLLAANGLCIRPNHTDWNPGIPIAC